MSDEYLLYIKGYDYPIFVWATEYQIQRMNDFFCFVLEGNYSTSFPINMINKIMLNDQIIFQNEEGLIYI